ncbi:MAG: acyltransferase family protein [Candidatus Magasanikbacteria bacterium]
MQSITPKKRNHFISYIKGYAILSVMLIHLIDWSNINVNVTGNWLKELLYPGVFFFMSTAGSVVYIAYGKAETWSKPAWKLFKRGWQLIGMYYLYNIIKLFIYDFSKEPFYWQYTEHGKMNWQNILTLHVFSSPIGILLTIGALIILSPILLFITKKIKWSNLFISLILLGIIINAYFIPTSGLISDFVFSQNNISFPLALWSIPFVAGYLIASLGFEERKHWWLAIFLPLAIVSYFYQTKHGLSIIPSHSMYPLQAYYLFVSLLFTALLFYIFFILEKIPCSIMKKVLSLIRFWGDSTLAIYVYHWIVVDLVMWAFFPQTKLIWVAVPIFLLLYTIVKRAKFKEYLLNQV